MAPSMILDYLNVAMTLPVVFLALVMLSHWFPKAVQLLRSGGADTGEDWLILGVTIGFSGFILNALFWGFHFFVDFMNWAKWFDITYYLGPKVNVFTRHIPYWISAACHIVAFWKYNKTTAIHPRTFFALSILWVGIFYVLLWCFGP